MVRCSDPLCSNVISQNGSYVRVDGKVYCNMKCRMSWDMANTALKHSSDPFRNSHFARHYPLCDDACTCPKCKPPPAIPERAEETYSGM